jgi:thiol-disulfide isomerase/thioredoxin
MKTRFIQLPALMILLISAVEAGAVWVNDPAPAFELTTLEGDKKGYSPDGKNVALINFWASWCPPCKSEFPKLNALSASYAGKDVRVIAVTLDKALANVNRFLEKNGEAPLSLELLRDPDAEAAKRYAARAMPMSFVVDRAGKVRYVHMGFQPGDEIRWHQEIDALLAEKAQ